MRFPPWHHPTLFSAPTSLAFQGGTPRRECVAAQSLPNWKPLPETAAITKQWPLLGKPLFWLQNVFHHRPLGATELLRSFLFAPVTRAQIFVDVYCWKNVGLDQLTTVGRVFSTP